MESASQASQYQRQLKSGEIVFVYNDDNTSGTSPLNTVTHQEQVKFVHAETQTDHGSNKEIATASSPSTSSTADNTMTKDYNTTGTETDISSVGDRKTLEMLLRWALALCTSGSDFSTPFQDGMPSYRRNQTRNQTTGINNASRPARWPQTGSTGFSLRRGRKRKSKILSKNIGHSMHVTQQVTAPRQLDIAGPSTQEEFLTTSDLKVFVPHEIRTLNEECGPIECDEIVALDNTTITSVDQLPLYEEATPSSPSPTVTDSVTAGRPLLAGQRWILPKPSLTTGESSGTSLETQSGTLGNPISDDSQQRNTCVECNQSFRTRPELDNHMHSHYKDLGVRPYECELCQKRFSFPSLLTMHMRSHSGERPLQCPVCDKSFAYQSSLRCHMRTHSGEKPYECSVCHKRFTQRGNLSDHMRIHTGEAPHACPHCPKRFTHQTTLRRHVRIHTGSRYECPYCDKKYCQENGLKIHLRSKHTGERPYVCEHCDSRFTAKAILKRHLEMHLARQGKGPLQARM